MSQLPRPQPSSLPRSVVMLFSCASAVSVSNVYFAQPLLDALATDFHVPLAAIGGVVTATQIGSFLALLFLVPFGDRFDRRKLTLLQMGALVVACVGVSTATTHLGLLAGMLAVGLLGTAMTQGLISYAASAAAPGERGRVVGAVQSGVVIGLILARVWAGAVADLAGWRSVYLGSAFVMTLLAMLTWRRLPRQPNVLLCAPYSRLIRSTVDLLRQDRVLQVRGFLAMLMFAAFNVFWSALVLPLSAPPYQLSHTAIGAFGLIGAAGAAAASRAGRWADAGFGQRTSGAALVILLVSWVPLGAMPHSLWWLALGVLLLDLGGQALHVTNQAMILEGAADSHSRLISCYMLFYAVGSGAGGLASTATYARYGWPGVCVLGASISLTALCTWAVSIRYRSSRRNCRGSLGGNVGHRLAMRTHFWK